MPQHGSDDVRPASVITHKDVPHTAPRDGTAQAKFDLSEHKVEFGTTSSDEDRDFQNDDECLANNRYMQEMTAEHEVESGTTTADEDGVSEYDEEICRQAM